MNIGGTWEIWKLSIDMRLNFDIEISRICVVDCSNEIRIRNTSKALSVRPNFDNCFISLLPVIALFHSDVLKLAGNSSLIDECMVVNDCRTIFHENKFSYSAFVITKYCAPINSKLNDG